MKLTIILLIAILLSCQEEEKRSSYGPANIDLITNDTNTIKNTFRKSKDPLISRFPEIKTREIDSNSTVYWQMVKKGKAAIPALIDGLTDTTETNIYDKCKKGNLNIGELCFYTLIQIADFPPAAVTDMQFCTFDPNGCSGFDSYLLDNSMKPKFQEKVKTFYAENYYHFDTFKDTELNASQKKYGIRGRYNLVHY